MPKPPKKDKKKDKPKEGKSINPKQDRPKRIFFEGFIKNGLIEIKK